MAGLKTVAEVVAKLAERYDGPTKQVKGSGGGEYTYIPWDEAQRKMDDVFGPVGWSMEPISYEGHPEQGIYLATVKLTAQAIDDETGTIITFTRGGFGRGVARSSKSEFDRTGNTVSADLSIHDTAAATAGSDAFTRATKYLGDAFGLFLYHKEEQQQGGYSQQRQPTQGGFRPQGNGARQPFNGTIKEPGAPATENQIKMLRLRGYDGATDGLTKAEASQLIDSLN